MKRLWLLLLLLAGLACAVAAGGSWVLGRWLPQYGRATLEAAVEERWPVDVSLGTLRYHLFQGLTVSDVAVTDPHGRVLFAAPEVRLHPRFAGLLFGRIGFGGEAQMRAPYQAPLVLAGWVRLGGSAWRLDAQVREAPLAALAPVLAERKPSALTDGAFALRLRLDQAGGGPVRAGVVLIGSRVRWLQDPIVAVADVAADGEIVFAPGGLQYDLRLAISDGRVSGVPLVREITALEGRGRLTPAGVRIEGLTGDALGTTWRVEGMVAPLQRPAVELLLAGTPELAQLAGLWIDTGAWHPDGVIDLTASCRGPLTPALFLDCQAMAQTRGVTVAPPMLAAPLTGITSRLGYDLLERRVTVEALEAQLAGQPVQVRGSLLLRDPPEAALSVDGAVDAHTVRGWLEHAGVTEASGLAAVALEVDGPITGPEIRGRIELQGMAGRLGGQRLEALTGALVLEPPSISSEALRLQVNGQPVTLFFTARTGTVPVVRATASLPDATVSVNARIMPEAVLFDAASLELAQSRLQLSGTVSRDAGATTAARIQGLIELSDLTQLALLPLPVLASWAPSGQVQVDATFEGQPAAWPQASWRGRLRGEALRLKDVPVEQLLCEFDSQAGAIRLGIPSASVAGGQLQADVSLEPRAGGTGFLLKADVAQLQLDRLAASLPAWRGRDIRGVAAASAVLSGTWQQRATWVGEGWLNASGERLGELPLLEKVFQGFFGVLADRLGLEALRRGQITQAGFQWQLSQERLHTEDLRVSGTSGGEPVAVYARGSVGLDQTLDLVIEPELSEGILLQAPSTSSVANTVLKAANRLDRFRRLVGQHRLTGTLKQPEYRFEFSLPDVFRQLAPAPEDLLQGLLNTLGGGN